MSNYIKFGLISLSAAAVLTGCGGGGSVANSATVGKAYYLDSAVEGVSYKCGTKESKTGSDGSFLFEKGQDCKFYIGDIHLRDIDSQKLSKKLIIEDNATIAAFLQTIDIDGNADNGIQVDKGVIATLKAENIKSLPKTETQLRDVWNTLKDKDSKYKGKLVDKDTAMAHVEKTKQKHQKNQDGMHENESVTAWFGDKENNRIDVVDVNSMQLIDEIPTGHQKTYAAEVVKFHGEHTQTPKMYVDNRGSDAIDVLNSSDKEIVKTIDLPFHPRSISVNKETGLVAVSGVDKPMVAIIDGKTDTLIATVGKDVVTYPVTSGHSYVSSGTLACGHPGWLDESHFVLLDRQNKEISTYKIYKDTDGNWQTELVNTIKTPSPVHDLIPPEVHGQAGHEIKESNKNEKHTNDNDEKDHNGNGKDKDHNGNEKHLGDKRYSTVFYATAEGATDVYPSVLKLDYDENKGLSIVDELNITKPGLSPNVMGLHHLNFMKNHKYIYVGSDEGDLFIVRYDKSPMKIEKIVPAGKGAGHAKEFEHGNIAVVINHKDKFITVMNTATNTKIADINVRSTSTVPL